jgi:hypothetical protein
VVTRAVISPSPRPHRRQGDTQTETPQMRIIALLTLAVIVLVSASGCATIPRETAADWTVLLPAGCAAYFSINLSADNRDVVAAVWESLAPLDFDSDAALQRTDRVYGALRASEGRTTLYAAAGGRYPKAATRYGFAHSNDWTEVELKSTGRISRKGSRSEDVYWINRHTPIQVHLTRDSIFLLATSDLLPMIELYRDDRYSLSNRKAVPARLPEIVLQRMDASDMLVFFPALVSGPLLRPFGASLPVGDVWIEVCQDERGYALQGHFVLIEKESGQGFTKILKLLLLYLLKEGEIEGYTKRLKELEFIQRGELVRVRGLNLSEEELVRLIKRILLR